MMFGIDNVKKIKEIIRVLKKKDQEKKERKLEEERQGKPWCEIVTDKQKEDKIRKILTNLSAYNFPPEICELIKSGDLCWDRCSHALINKLIKKEEVIIRKIGKKDEIIRYLRPLENKILVFGNISHSGLLEKAQKRIDWLMRLIKEYQWRGYSSDNQYSVIGWGGAHVEDFWVQNKDDWIVISGGHNNWQLCGREDWEKYGDIKVKMDFALFKNSTRTFYFKPPYSLPLVDE